MTGPNHYLVAESCLVAIGERGPDEDSPTLMAEAQVHATLALAAATWDAACLHRATRNKHMPSDLADTADAWDRVTS